MPPTPKGERISYGPSFVPWRRGMIGGDYNLRMARSGNVAPILLNPGIETEKHLPAAVALHPHTRVVKRLAAWALLAGNHHHGVAQVVHLGGSQFRRN